nr:unnamed protein product [Digitaria exilis]
MAAAGPSPRRRFAAAVVALALALVLGAAEARPDKEMREKFYGTLVTNGTRNATGDGSIAEMFGRVLDKEFADSDTPDAPDKSSFNNSVSDHQAVLETVAVITHDKKKNDSQNTNSPKPFQIGDMFGGQDETSDDLETVIDKEDNVFVMSNRKTKYPTLQLDIRLIKDLVVIIVSATGGGIIFSCMGQPVIVGYLLAGSLVGPGGLNFISEMVQVETFAQFGVVFLLFALGLEFSLTKLKVVGPVAVLGGLLQIALFMFLCGLTAVLCGAKSSEGVFVGAFLSMSSTAVVSKFLVEKGSTNTLHGQVTIGTLILQDCAVGLLFALLPVLGGASGIFGGVMSMAKLLLVLSIFIAVTYMMTWSIVPRFLKLMIQLSSQHFLMYLPFSPHYIFLIYVQTNELYQLASVAFCLLLAWVTTPLIFKLIPVVMHLGILMRWFPTENSMQNEVRFVTSFADFSHMYSKLDN